MKHNFKTPINQIKVAVCIDIGDGSCSAYAMRLDNPDQNKFAPMPLGLDKKGDLEIPSALYYYPNGSVDIGYVHIPPHESVDCVTNFKKSPHFNGAKESWLSTNDAMVFPKPFQENMESFISKLWKNIAEQASVDAGALKGLSAEEIAIYVGCPSSGNWNLPSQKEQYRELIKKATGMPNVAVVAESTAGICRTIRELGTTVDLSDRIAVLDFGSSTFDFTYIENGKIAAERSWTLGAHKIEYQMFFKMCDILIEQTQGELDKFSNLEAIADKGILAYLEERKERLLSRMDSLNLYSLHSPSGVLALNIRKIAKELYYDNRNKRKENESISFPYTFLDMGSVTIDDAFMDDVVKKMPIGEVSEGGDSDRAIPTDDPSWYGYCKAILEDIKENNIRKNPIQLIVTGGASRMDFIRPLCEEIFKDNLKKPIPKDPAPQNCVSYGLCQVAMNDARTADVIKRATDYFFKKEHFSDVYEVCQNICADIRRYLFECFYRIIDDEKTGILDDMSFKTFKSKVHEQMHRRVTKADLYEIVSKHRQSFERVMSLKYHKLEEFISMGLYNHNVYIGYNYHLTITEPCFNDINFSDGLDIMDFLTDAEINKIQKSAGSISNSPFVTNSFLELQLAWSVTKSIAKQFLGIEEPTQDEMIVHPILWKNHMQDHRTEFYTAIFSIMRKMGLPKFNFNKTGDVVEFFVDNKEFRDKIEKDIEQIVYGITLQNE